MRRFSNTVLLYAVFAAASIAVNLAGQAASSFVYRGKFALIVSMVVGTGAGLLCKYILDKRFILANKNRDASHETTTFLLYSIMGVATTIIFWGSELIFHHMFEAAYMRYVGAVIGLTVGYVAKYWLDKTLVFR